MSYTDYVNQVCEQAKREPHSLTRDEINYLARIWQVGGPDIVSLGVERLRDAKGRLFR